LVGQTEKERQERSSIFQENRNKELQISKQELKELVHRRLAEIESANIRNNLFHKLNRKTIFQRWNEN